MNRQQDFVCGGEVQSLEISRAEVLAYDLRRETYVHERPQPRGGDVISSTPIQAPRDLSTQEFLPPDLRRQTYIPESSQKLFGLEADMGAMLPPPDPRRQTYIPEKGCSASNLLQLPTVLPQNGRTMKRSPGKSKLTPVDEAAVPVAESWTPQKPWETEKVERKTSTPSESLGDSHPLRQRLLHSRGGVERRPGRNWFTVWCYNLTPSRT